MFENQLVVGVAEPSVRGAVRVQASLDRQALSGAQTGDLVAAYWRYQARRGLSSATRRAYGQYLARFAAWLGTRPVDAVRPADIELGYMAYWDGWFRVRYGRSPSPRTVRNNLVALNAFFAFLARFEHVTSNPVAQSNGPGSSRDETTD